MQASATQYTQNNKLILSQLPKELKNPKAKNLNISYI